MTSLLNSAGKIVTWQLTKETSISQVEQVLKDLHDRDEQQRCRIMTVYIEECVVSVPYHCLHLYEKQVAVFLNICGSDRAVWVMYGQLFERHEIY